jgi:glycosyltransferase involved in cell wall biosynthesis
MSISVVIPAYNASRYLRETLDSVLQQTLPADEILVIDDGSTDDTAAIAESYAPQVRVIRRPNARQAATRNFGVQEATGEWIAFVDADDIWECDKLRRQMDELAQHPEADLCYTARVELIQEGDTARIGRILTVPPPARIREALYRNTTFLPSAVVIRRSTFLAAGGFDTHYKYVEDWDLWLRLLRAGMEFAYCPEPLVRYRLHPQSVSHNAMPALEEVKAIYRNQVLPLLPASTRWLAHQRSQSGQEAAAAYTMRCARQPGYLPMMLRSIVRYPFNEPHRLKGLLYMIYTRLRNT